MCSVIVPRPATNPYNMNYSFIRLNLSQCPKKNIKKNINFKY